MKFESQLHRYKFLLDCLTNAEDIPWPQS